MFGKSVIFTFLICLSAQLGYAATVIPFKVINGLILVNAKVNNSEDGWFIYDTGAYEVLINGQSDYASNHFSNLNGAIHSQQVHVKSIELGNFRKFGIKAFKTDLTALEDYLSIELKGILGSSFFLPREIFFDLKKQVVVIDPDYDVDDFEFEQSFRLRSTNGISYIYFPYKDHLLKLGLDSGSSSHILSKKSIQKYRIKNQHASSYRLITHDGQDVLVRKILTDINIWETNGGSVFLQKDLEAFNSQLDIPLDGFLSITSLPYDYLYINKKKDFFGIGYFK